MVGIGVGEVFGAVTVGRLQDKCGDRIAVLCCLVFSWGGLMATLAFTLDYYFALWFAWIMTFCFGF